MEQEQFLDRRLIDSFVFNRLVENGYVPSIEEAQDVTDIFFELLTDLGIEMIEMCEDDLNESGSI
jgi:hypothetical protein